MKSPGRWFREDRDAYMLGYEFNSLLWRHDVVSVLGDDRFTSCRIHDRLMHERMYPFREQNPVVLCEILENQAFFVNSWMGFEKSSVERSPSERYSRDLNVLRWRRHECEAEFAYKNAAEGFHCELRH